MCTGLPYDDADAAQLAMASGMRVDQNGWPMRYYNLGEIAVELRERDFLQVEDFRLPGVAAWL
ncbi:MAG: hypothetical protein ABIY70_14425 [Capsulimonas sp.]|uniref:hypothetical protein n=1 Tax=Capsulimonas sp. TaxID=2494211 RepID=UPI00326617D0